jgi:hypothetical protein
MMQLNWEITVTHAYRDENFVDELVAMAFHLAAYYPQNFNVYFMILALSELESGLIMM